MTRQPKLLCDFCYRSELQVEKMVAGSNHAAICDECIKDAQQALLGNGHREMIAGDIGCRIIPERLTLA